MNKTITLGLLLVGQVSFAGPVQSILELGSTKLSGAGFEALSNSVDKMMRVRKGGSPHLVSTVAKDHGIVEVYRLEPKGTGSTGVMNQTVLQLDGSVVEYTYNLPPSTLPPRNIEVAEQVFSADNSTFGQVRPDKWERSGRIVKEYKLPGVTRTYQTPSGYVNEGASFEVLSRYLTEYSPQWVRVQKTEHIRSEIMNLIAVRQSFGNHDQLKVFLQVKIGDKLHTYKATIEIPNSEGQILSFHFNADASKLTVWTDRGEKLEYAITPDNFNGLARSESPVRRTSLDRAELQEFIAQKKKVAARSNFTDPAKGMEVEPAGVTATH
jgi:hypothetical protein